MDTARRLAMRQANFEAARSNWESLWEECARFVFPRGDDFRSKHAPGVERTQRQFDAFPGLALTRFAAALESGLTPRTAMWHKLSTGDEDLDDEIEVQRYLDELNMRLWRARYAPQGNFSSQMHEVYLSLGAFGTGPMLIEERAGGGVRYRSIHLSELYAAQNVEGLVDTVHRKFMMTGAQVVEQFGKEKTPDKILKRFEKGHTEDEFEFLHCVEPNSKYEAGKIGAFKFSSWYCFEGKMVDEGGFHEMPYIVPRYMTASREVYGRGPAIQLLPDIKMLQEMRRTTIEAANLTVDPPVLLHEADILSEFSLMPGARNPGGVDDNGRQRAIPYQTGADVGLGLEMIADVRGQIDDGFLGVYFRVLLENPQMTATQALLIAQQQGQMTSPVIGRLQTEALGPMLRREAGILRRQGKLPPVPDVVAEHMMRTRQPLEIEYESPMTRAVETEQSVAILRSFETLASVGQIAGPAVFRRYKWDEVSQVVNETNGVPARVLMTDEELEQADQQQAAQQGLEAALQAAPIAAETAKTLAETQQISQNNPQPVA